MGLGTISRAAIAVIALGLAQGGCSSASMIPQFTSAYPSVNRDLSLLTPGVPRLALLGEFGRPVHMEIRDGVRRDMFRFIQGPPKRPRRMPPAGQVIHEVADVGEQTVHGAMNVATDGAWQGGRLPGLVGTEIVVEVFYDREDRVTAVNALKGGEELEPQPMAMRDEK